MLSCKLKLPALEPLLPTFTFLSGGLEAAGAARASCSSRSGHSPHLPAWPVGAHSSFPRPQVALWVRKAHPLVLTEKSLSWLWGPRSV